MRREESWKITRNWIRGELHLSSRPIKSELQWWPNYMHHFPTNAGNGVINYKAGNFRSMFCFRIDHQKKGRAVLSLFDDCWWLSRDSTGDVIASRQLRLMFENDLFSAGWMQCQWPQMGRDRFASAEKQLFQFESNVRCDTRQPMHRKETKKWNWHWF